MMHVCAMFQQVSRAKAASGSATGEVYTGFWQSLSTIYKVEGVKGLFRGSTARVTCAPPKLSSASECSPVLVSQPQILFHAPMQAITMMSYEQCKRIFSALS